MNKVLKVASASLTGIAFVVLLLVLAITFVDVVGRYFFNSPLTYSVELVQLGMGAIVLCGLPMTTMHRGHVSVDLVEHTLPKPMRSILQIFASFCTCFVLALFAWRLWERAIGFRSDGIGTDVLFLPIWPVVFLMAVAAGVAAIIAATQIMSPGNAHEGPATNTDTHN